MAKKEEKKIRYVNNGNSELHAGGKVVKPGEEVPKSTEPGLLAFFLENGHVVAVEE